MVDLIVYEEQESKYLIVVNLRIVVHRTQNYVTNDILIVNHIEINSDVDTANNIKSIFISNEGYISNKKRYNITN